MFIDDVDWKSEYQKHCKKSQEQDKEFETYCIQKDHFIFDAFKGSAEEIAIFKQGFNAAKTYYMEVVQIRTNMLRDEQFFLHKKTKEFIEAKQKIKDLIAECELYANLCREIESHKLTKCVRFLQTLRNKARFKLATISRTGRQFLRSFLPDKYDGRSQLYKTLQQHLNKEDNLGNKINKQD